MLRTGGHRAPVAHLPPEGFEAWFSARSSNFRQQMRRLRRRLEADGGSVRLAATPDELDRDLDALMRLHRGRWGEHLVDGRVEAMLRDAAHELAPAGRLRIWVVEVAAAPASVLLFAAAGGEVHYWNGGFDPAFASLRPSLLAILAALEDACERGERRLDLGPGAHDYKLRFADGDAPLSWEGLAVLRPRYPLTRAELLPTLAGARARRLASRLSPGRRAWLRARLGRG